MVASMISPRLCGGMLVAMPTAMPPEPLTSRFGNARRQDRRLLLRVVEVRREVDACPCRCRRGARPRSARGAPRCSVGRRRVAVDRAVVALAVDERVAHREVLRHADQRVVDATRRRAGGTCRARRRRPSRTSCTRPPAPRALLVHRVEDAAVHRLEAVARVGDGAPDDDAHRVVEVARAHLVLQADGLVLQDVAVVFGHADGSPLRLYGSRKRSLRMPRKAGITRGKVCTPVASATLQVCGLLAGRAGPLAGPASVPSVALGRARGKSPNVALRRSCRW